MYKLIKTFTLLSTLGMVAFSCEPSDGPTGEPPGFMDRAGGSIILVNIDTINLVGLEEWRTFHPSNIKILNEHFEDTGLQFIKETIVDSSWTNYDTISYWRSPSIELPYGGNADYARIHYQNWKYTYYFQYPNGDYDTLKLEYDMRLVSDDGDWPPYEYYYVIQKMNGRDLIGPLNLPEFKHYPKVKLGGLYFKNVE